MKIYWNNKKMAVTQKQYAMENRKETFKIWYSYPKEDVTHSVWKIDNEENLA